MLAPEINAFGRSASKPGYRRPRDIVAESQLLERGSFRASLPRLSLLNVGQLRRAPHMLPPRLGAAAALRRAGADEVALHIGKATEDSDHQPPGAGRGVGPRLSQ